MISEMSLTCTLQVEIEGGAIGFNISGKGGDGGQGIGSVSIIGKFTRLWGVRSGWLTIWFRLQHF